MFIKKISKTSVNVKLFFLPKLQNVLKYKRLTIRLTKFAQIGGQFGSIVLVCKRSRDLTACTVPLKQ